MAKKTLDPKAKAKRQKIIAGIGGVLLIGLLAFQIPRTMKMLKGDQTTQPPTSTAPTSSPSSGAPLAPPTLNGSTPSATPASTGSSTSGLANTNGAPAASSGQLVSFSRFGTKDPFAQQVQAACLDSAASDGAAQTSAQCGSTSSPKTSTPSVPVTTPVTTIPVTPAAPASPLTTATISVDGVASVVKVGSAFPQAQPIFQLVSLTRTTAKISIVGGSLEGGAATMTLAKGKRVTLLNTADGSRYVLKLIATAA